MLRGMFGRGILVVAALASLATGARAEEPRPARIWLECATPRVWPARPGPLRLRCRLEMPSAAGPAFWETVNPFEPQDLYKLVDPFAVEATARSVHVRETGRARGRRARTMAFPPLVDPFVSEADDVINPFEPVRKETE
jgi:hypothetical protein